MHTQQDPFDTATLREAVLDSWRRSPTRFTEDANAEEDLRLGAYADRLFVELAQNAADAASLGGTAGTMKVSVVGRELRIANSGAELDRTGVSALASLRASAKRGQSTVGRFGVGFAAVLTACVEPRVISRNGGVVFSEERTRELVEDMPQVRDQLARRQGAVPVLRLPWPAAEHEPEPPAGFDTEVRLPLRDEVDADALLAEMANEVEDVLLTFPALERIDVAGTVWNRHAAQNGVVEIARSGLRINRWLLHTATGEFDAEQAASLGVEAAQRPQWTVLWALPVDEDGVPDPVEQDVLHAPTATDERLSIPARLVASMPIEPSRRRVHTGLAASAVLRAAARAYHELLTRVTAAHRLALVPTASFPLSEVDGQLREAIVEELRQRPWLPPSAGGDELPGARAQVLEVDSPRLAELLAEVFPFLTGAGLVGPVVSSTLTPVGALPLTVAGAVNELIGLQRPAAWWRALYDALLDLLDARSISHDDLAGLSVPLTTSRTTPGARGVLLPGAAAGSDASRPESGNQLHGELLDLVTAADITGMRIAHPDVSHPLLERLGAVHIGAADLLDLAELHAAVRRSVDDAQSGVDTTALAELVLWLVDDTGAGWDAQRPWLADLALPTVEGELRRAAELLLPASPLLDVLAADAVGGDCPLDVLDSSMLDRWAAWTLVAVGVLDTFAVVVDSDPAGPEHELPDEHEWWDSHSRPPERVHAVRDLDLVSDDAWPEALRLLGSRYETWHALTEPDGHTGWWIARFGSLAGYEPMHWRLPESGDLAGLYDPAPDVGLSSELLTAAGVRSLLAVRDVADAHDLLERLADAQRNPHAGVVLRAHAALAELAQAPDVDIGLVDAPHAVRVLDGSVTEAERACVLDQPWLLDVLDPAVLVGCTGSCAALAELLDLPMASETYRGEVSTVGETVPWSTHAAVGELTDLLGVSMPEGSVCMHGELLVRIGQADSAPLRARWWVDDDGVVHAEDSIAGLARAFAHTTGRWDARYLIGALLSDPDPATVLG